MYAFCIACNMNHLRTSSDQFMQQDQALIDIWLVENQNNPLHVATALEVIERLILSKDSKDPPLLSQRIEQTREETSNIFNHDNIKSVIACLDFNAETKTSRDGANYIMLQDEKKNRQESQVSHLRCGQLRDSIFQATA